MTSNGWVTKRTAAGPASIPYDAIDKAMLQHMNVTGADIASISVIYDNVLRITKDYGPTHPDVRYRDASVQKSITATAIRRVINAGTGGLTLGTTVRSYLGFGTPLDARCSNITVQHLIDHKGGWDLNIAGDPIFQNRRVADALGVASPPTQRQLSEYALTKVWLEYDPGSTYMYSNVGYAILAEVLEAATGLSFLDYIQAMMALIDAEATGGRNEIEDPREPYYQVHGYDAAMVPSVYHEGIVGYRGGTSGTSGSAAEISTARFSEVIPGDLMIATVRTAAGTVIQSPGGWERGPDLGLGNEGWWYRYAESPDVEPTTYEWSEGTETPTTWTWAIDIFGGVSPTTPFDATPTASQGTDATADWLTLNTVTAKAWSYLVSIDRPNTDDLPLPTNYTQRISQAGTPGAIRTSTREITTPGAVAPTTTDAATRDHGLYSIPLKPAASVMVPYPYGGFAIENQYGGGGMVYSTRDLAKYLVAIWDGTFPQPETGAVAAQGGTPYEWNQVGSLPGTWALIFRKWDTTHLRGCAASFNSRSGLQVPDESFIAEIEAVLDTMV